MTAKADITVSLDLADRPGLYRIVAECDAEATYLFLNDPGQSLDLDAVRLELKGELGANLALLHTKRCSSCRKAGTS
jgi:hypothetical protein